MTIQREVVYSEIFHSVQGEGSSTGQAQVWIRFHNCNLECRGFSQEDPTDKNTWILDYDDFANSDQLIHLEKIEDLPVFPRGCDSYYSWHKSFKRFMFKDAPADVANKLKALTPENSFMNKFSQVKCGIAFTGGESMMSQNAIVDILQHYIDTGDYPTEVTIETNGTKRLNETLHDFILDNASIMKFTFSISPKLFHVTGEVPEKCIQPDVIKSYEDVTLYSNDQGKSSSSYLKFVVNGNEGSWNDMYSAIKAYREVGVLLPVWVMPVGATQEQQELTAGDIATRAIAEGFNVSARVHNYLWGNAVGV